jgi:hypothetical protein
MYNKPNFSVYITLKFSFINNPKNHLKNEKYTFLTIFVTFQSKVIEMSKCQYTTYLWLSPEKISFVK